MKLSVEDTDAYEVAVFSGVLLTASSSSKLMAVAMFFALRLLTIGLILFDHVRSVSSEAFLNFQELRNPLSICFKNEVRSGEYTSPSFAIKIKKMSPWLRRFSESISPKRTSQLLPFANFWTKREVSRIPGAKDSGAFFFQLPRYGPWSSSLVEVSH